MAEAVPTIDPLPCEATIHTGDALAVLATLPGNSVQCCVTSPPYWGLRDYGVEGQIGLEPSPEEFIGRMVEVFAQVRRVLRPDGTCWINMGDTYCAARSGGIGTASTLTGSQDGQKAYRLARSCRSFRRDRADCGGDNHKAGSGLKPKDLIGVPWMLAFALRADGWYLRQDIIWHKPSPMPESVSDRCTKAHEYIFLLTKSPRYFYDAQAIKEPGVGPEMSVEDYERCKAETAEQWYVRVDGPPPGPNKQANNLLGCHCPPGGRNKRSVWTMASRPFAEAHFATFPPGLPETCILAGTSEKGCCPQCGTPWQRIVERQRKATRPGSDTKVTGNAMTDGNRDPQRHVTTTATTGWRAACQCGASPVPCTVLDPFNGAGTTGLVAQRLGRRYIGIELNPAYVAMTRSRLHKDRPLFAPPAEKHL